jgi:hypothetical protein
MKRLILILLMFISVGSSANVDFSAKKVRAVKEGKLIIGLYEHSRRETEAEKNEIDFTNKLLEGVIKKNWSFSKIDTVMYIKDARKFVRRNKGYFILQPLDVYVGGSAINETSIVTMNEQIAIFENAFSYYGIYFPAVENPLNEASITYMVTTLQYLFEKVDAGEAKSVRDLLFKIDKNVSDVLKNKVLLVPENLFYGKVTKEMFAEVYPYDIEFCSVTEYEKAILQKCSDCVYLVYFLQPTRSRFFHYNFLVNASDGGICACIPLSRQFSLMSILFTNRKVKPVNKRWLKNYQKKFSTNSHN